MRSNSWSDSVDFGRAAADISRTLLGDTHRLLCDNIKKYYGEMLYRWNLLVKRAKVLKYLTYPTDVSRGVEFVTECSVCRKVTYSPYCDKCHKSILYCAICRLPVRGSANGCISCGHGGHTEHMMQWFEVALKIL